MIKLTDIVNELNINKNNWKQLSKSETDSEKDQILALIQNAYKEIGGHPNFKSPTDVTSGEGGDSYQVIDLDDDNDIDAVTVTKERPAGHKLVAMGQDGTMSAKKSAIDRQVANLKTPGWYIEVSGKIKDILLAKGVKPVEDEATVRKALDGKEIKWNGDGTYDRKIGGEVHTKLMLGRPKK
jgi:hypothetical protein